MSRIYIGRLSFQAREKDVERFFRGFGRIKDINLKNGFGFVEFDDSRDADDAVYELNGRDLLGERVIVEHARGGGYGRGSNHRSGGRGYGPPARTDYRLVVENLSSRVSWQDLKDFMRQAGEITYADAHKQRVGEGVVEYANYDDMKNAVKKLDGVELKGRKLRLFEDSKRSRKRSRSRSKSRSRSNGSVSRSRSRSRSARRSRSKGKSPDHVETRTSAKDIDSSANKDKNPSRSPSRGKASPKDESPSRSPSREKGSPRAISEDVEQPTKSRSRSPSPGQSPRQSQSPERSPAPEDAKSSPRSPDAADVGGQSESPSSRVNGDGEED